MNDGVKKRQSNIDIERIKQIEQEKQRDDRAQQNRDEKRINDIEREKKKTTS